MMTRLPCSDTTTEHADCGVKSHLTLVSCEKNVLHTSEESSLHAWIRYVQWNGIFQPSCIWLTKYIFWFYIRFHSSPCRVWNPIASITDTNLEVTAQATCLMLVLLKLHQRTWREAICSLFAGCRKKNLPISWLVNLCQFLFPEGVLPKKNNFSESHRCRNSNCLWPTCCIHVLSNEP